jgi:hypothetical protein
VGAICWLDGRVHSADLFASSPLFAASRSKLLRSYCTDAELRAAPKKTPVDLRACQEFLDAIVKSRRELAERGAYETRFKIKDGKVTGYEAGRPGFGGGLGGGIGGFGHGSYRPGK